MSSELEISEKSQRGGIPDPKPNAATELYEFAREMKSSFATIPGAATKSKLMWLLYEYLNTILGDKTKAKQILREEMSKENSVKFTHDSIRTLLSTHSITNEELLALCLAAENPLDLKKSAPLNTKSAPLLKSAEDEKITTIALYEFVKNNEQQLLATDKEWTTHKSEVMWGLHKHLKKIFKDDRNKIKKILAEEFAKGTDGFTGSSITETFLDNKVPEHVETLDLLELANSKAVATYQTKPFNLNLTKYVKDKKEHKVTLDETPTLTEIGHMTISIQNAPLVIAVTNQNNAEKILDTLIEELNKADEKSKKIAPQMYGYIRAGLHSRGFLAHHQAAGDFYSLIAPTGYQLDSENIKKTLNIVPEADGTFTITEQCSFFKIIDCRSSPPKQIFSDSEKPLFTLTQVSKIRVGSEKGNIIHETVSSNVTSCLAENGPLKRLVEMLKQNPEDVGKLEELVEMKKSDSKSERITSDEFKKLLEDALTQISATNAQVPSLGSIAAIIPGKKAARNKKLHINTLQKMIPLLEKAKTPEEVRDIFRATDGLEYMHEPSDGTLRMFSTLATGKPPLPHKKESTPVMRCFADYCITKSIRLKKVSELQQKLIDEPQIQKDIENLVKDETLAKELLEQEMSTISTSSNSQRFDFGRSQAQRTTTQQQHDDSTTTAEKTITKNPLDSFSS